MGVDTVIIAEHKIDDLQQIPDLLKSCDNLFIKHHKILKEHWIPSSNPVQCYIEDNYKSKPSLKWKWIQPPVGKHFPELKGPLGIWLNFNGVACKNLYSIDIAPRWGSVIYDIEIQRVILDLVKCIAETLGGNKAIFVPDSAYCPSIAADEYPEMNGLSEVEAFLLKKCGKPKSSLSAIRTMLTDDEMYTSDYYEWDGNEDSRGFEDDGYFVFKI